MGNAVEVAKVLVDPVMKLLDMVGSAAGTIYEPHHLRKMADAEAYKIKALGSAISEIPMLSTSYDNGSIALSSTDTDDLFKRAEMREKFQKVREQKNIENIIGYAQQELLGMGQVPNTPVDDDWMTRLLNNAKDISSETMQFIWGKILAGEVAAPNSFSKRTLDTIRNLSQYEAGVFQKMLPYIVRAGGPLAITARDKIYKMHGISYGDILLLDECGLMTSGIGISFNVDVYEEPVVVAYNEDLLLLAHCSPEQSQKISISLHNLTKAGHELYKILVHESNSDYFLDWAKDIAQKYRTVQFAVHKINFISEGEIDYEDSAIITLN